MTNKPLAPPLTQAAEVGWAAGEGLIPLVSVCRVEARYHRQAKIGYRFAD